MRTKHIIPKHAADFSTAFSGEGDPFAAFPDAVLGLILSHLPFRAAVAASAVSRRWRYAVSLSPSLDLSFPASTSRRRGGRAAFAAAASAAISLSPSSPLLRLRLSLAGFFSDSDSSTTTYASLLSSWLSAAAARGLRELHLSLPRCRRLQLPDSLFQSHASLTSLTLNLQDYSFPLPSPSPLTNLASLRLASVSLLGAQGADFMQELFSHCTLLEQLHLEGCRVGALELIAAAAPRLRMLTIADCHWTLPASVTVSGIPALESFRYVGPIANAHAVEGAIRLDEVFLDLEKPGDCDGIGLENLVALVGNVRSLMLSPWCIEHLSRSSKRSEVWLDKVKKLACVIERREEGVQSVASLLGNCPHVEELSVSVVPSQCMRRRSSTSENACRHQVGGGKGMLRHLKTVRMEYIDESKAGLELVKLLLKNARVLERMTIVPSNDGLEHAKFRRKVSKLRRASQDVSISYCVAE